MVYCDVTGRGSNGVFGSSVLNCAKKFVLLFDSGCANGLKWLFHDSANQKPSLIDYPFSLRFYHSLLFFHLAD